LATGTRADLCKTGVPATRTLTAMEIQSPNQLKIATLTAMEIQMSPNQFKIATLTAMEIQMSPNQLKIATLTAMEILNPNQRDPAEGADNIADVVPLPNSLYKLRMKYYRNVIHLKRQPTSP
jgi:hypothetical protein